MKKVSILLVAIFCLSCKFPHAKRKFNSEAIKLNNQALSLLFNSGRSENDQILDSAVVLLNKAIQIDSGYFTAYINKFNFQNDLKQYGNAISTGKQIIKLRPNNYNIKLLLGEDYEKLGDTLSSVSYYNAALSDYNKILDTMNVNNKAYGSFLSSKAITLIMLHKRSQGYDILNEMVAKETNPDLKQMYEEFVKMSRNDWLFSNLKKNATYSDPVRKN